MTLLVTQERQGSAAIPAPTGGRTELHPEAVGPRPLSGTFSYLEPVCCSMSSSNCGFLTCIQISQEAGQEVWYSHLLKNFPQFVVIPSGKETTCNAGDRRDADLILGWDGPLEEGMGTHSSVLAWKIPWMEEPGGLQSMGEQRARHD